MSEKGKELYQEYLKSDTWGIIRLQRLAVDNNECVLCSERAEHVHHRRYPKKWGIETVNDLVSLCSACHAKHHLEETETGNRELIIPEDPDGEVHHIYDEKSGDTYSVDEIHNLFNLNDCISKIINSQTGHYDLWFSEVFNERKEIERRLDKLEKQNG